MTYPQHWQDVSAARHEWTPPEAIAADFAEIQFAASPYTFCLRFFDMAKPIVDDLDTDGLRLALGCAAIINAAQFDYRHTEALEFITAHAARVAEPPPA